MPKQKAAVVIVGIVRGTMTSQQFHDVEIEIDPGLRRVHIYQGEGPAVAQAPLDLTMIIWSEGDPQWGTSKWST